MAVASVAIKLEDEIRGRLQALGSLKDHSMHWLMKRAILEYLEREERYERELQEDRGRWEKYMLTGDAVPHADMKGWLQTLGQA